MAVNRFWGQAPLAEFSPTSMQEMMFAPQQLYQREQDLSSKVEAMNEAKQTLQSVLGDKAGKSQEFESKYQNLINSISKEGSTKKNMDDAKALRSLYVKEVLPMEQFAKERQDMYHSWLKASADANNIVIGDNPLAKTFDEYRKSGFAPFQTVDRNKLMQQGLLIGKQYAEGETKQSFDPQYGFLNIQKGFKNADEAMNAYKTNPSFQKWVDEQANMAAKASGIDSSNEDVNNSIRNGIMSAVVGGVERRQLPNEIIKGIIGGQVPNVDLNAVDVYNKVAHVDKNWDVIARDPLVKSSIDAMVAEKTGGEIKSFDELNSEIQKIDPSIMQTSSYAVSPMGMYAGSVRPGSINQSIGRLNSLKNIKNSVVDILRNSPDYSNEISVFPNKTVMAHMEPEERTKFEKSMEGAADDIDRTIATWANKDKSGGEFDGTYNGIWGGASPDDRKALVKYAKAPEDKRKLIITDYSVNSYMDKDNKMHGSGQPLATLWIKWGDKPEENSTITMSLPRNLMDKVRTNQTILAQRYSKEQKELMDRLNDQVNKYYQLEDQHLLGSKK